MMKIYIKHVHSSDKYQCVTYQKYDCCGYQLHSRYGRYGPPWLPRKLLEYSMHIQSYQKRQKCAQILTPCLRGQGVVVNVF